MYVTVLSGHVAQEDWLHLRQSFEKLCTRPPEGLVEIELIQGMEDRGLWEVVTTWASQEAFEEANRKNLTAACEQMFCEAGSIPRRTQYKLVTRYERV